MAQRNALSTEDLIAGLRRRGGHLPTLASEYGRGKKKKKKKKSKNMLSM